MSSKKTHDGWSGILKTKHLRLVYSTLKMCSAWTPAQVYRLKIERDLLEKYFPGRVTWSTCRGATTVEVKLDTNNNHKYTLRIEVPDDIPNSCPKLWIVSPKNLRQRNGEPLPENSSQFHTLAVKDGCMSICHFYPLHWNAQDTLYEVFMKGRLWIEAYEGHLNSGQPINNYLPEQVDAMVPLIDLLTLSLLGNRS